MNHKFISLLVLLYCISNIVARAQDTKTLYLGKDSIPMQFVKIPKGAFEMGSKEGAGFFQKDELPLHPVRISQDFYIGKYEVTQAVWESIMPYNPSVFLHPQKPIDMVSWNDCQEFIQKLNQLGLGTFRMPTEAEWEYACKLGDTDYWDEKGNVIPWKLEKYAHFHSRAEGKSHLVGDKLSNRLGVYDMAGNVWEWCSDWKGVYEEGLQTDPQGPKTGVRKIIRGGSWFNEPEALRPANRNAHKPHEVFTNIGLRLVLLVE